MMVHGLKAKSGRSVLRAALVAALGIGGVVVTATAASASPPYHTVAGTRPCLVSARHSHSLMIAIRTVAS